MILRAHTYRYTRWQHLHRDASLPRNHAVAPPPRARDYPDLAKYAYAQGDEERERRGMAGS